MNNQRYTFSGQPEENAQVFINLCRFQWVTVTIDEELRSKAIATTIVSGCRGEALRFVRSLPRKERNTWTLLEERLLERFPEPKVKDMDHRAFERMSKLTQGSMSLKEYVDQAWTIRYSVPASLEDPFYTLFIDGLSVEGYRIYLRGYRADHPAASFVEIVRRLDIISGYALYSMV